MWYDLESSQGPLGAQSGADDLDEDELDDEALDDEDDLDDDDDDDDLDDDLIVLDDEYDDVDEERNRPHPPHHKFDD